MHVSAVVCVFLFRASVTKQTVENVHIKNRLRKQFFFFDLVAVCALLYSLVVVVMLSTTQPRLESTRRRPVDTTQTHIFQGPVPPPLPPP